MGQQMTSFLFSLFAIARAFVCTDANEYGLESSRSTLTLTAVIIAMRYLWNIDENQRSVM